MNSEQELESRLSQIETSWTKLLKARTGERDEARQAQTALLQRYNGAILRYLLKGAGNLDAAEELFQEFALRFVRDDFDNATPERGRFRFFLKRSLANLLIDHHRKKKKQFMPLAADAQAPADEHQEVRAAESAFTEACRADVLQRTWNALAAADSQAATPFYVILRVRADHPEMRSPQLAEIVGARLGKKVTAEWVRNRLHFARARFTDLLLAEIEKTLTTPTLDDLEQEVVELGLLDYCRDALAKRPRPTKKLPSK